MSFYYFNNNADENDFHEVHESNCTFCPSTNNRTLIGYFSNCTDAIEKAKINYPGKKFDGCFFCCRECHKG